MVAKVRQSRDQTHLRLRQKYGMKNKVILYLPRFMFL